MVSAARRGAWGSIEDVDVPLRQHHLSKAIDKAVFDELCTTAPDSRSKALALSSAIHHAGDWLNVVPWVSIWMIGNVGHASSIGWVSR